MSSAELKMRAKEQLKGYWGIAIATVLVAEIIINMSVAFKTAAEFGGDGISYSINIIMLI